VLLGRGFEGAIVEPLVTKVDIFEMVEARVSTFKLDVAGRDGLLLVGHWSRFYARLSLGMLLVGMRAKMLCDIDLDFDPRDGKGSFKSP